MTKTLLPKAKGAAHLPAMAIAVIAGGILLAACSPVDEASSASEASGEATESGSTEGEATRGGTVTVGRLADIVSPDGHVLGAVNRSVHNHVYGRLMGYDRDFNIVPQLAESIDINEDSSAATITLREGITFHDGTPITAEVVVANLERVADPETGASQVVDLAGSIADIETPDDRTVVIRYDQPTPAMTDMLNLLAIVDPATIDGDAEGVVVNGSGPYRFVEWSQGQQIILERYEEYWNEDQALLDRIEFSILGDPEALSVQLEAGAVDVAEGVRPEDAQRLESAGFNLVVDSSDMLYIAANTENEPFDDVRARQAINYAIDRQRFVDESLGGLAEPTSLPWPPDSPASDAEAAQTYAFDLDKARELLDEAGVEDGATLELVLNNAQPPLEDLAQILQADLSEIGVSLEVRPLDPPQWRPLAREATYEGLLAGPYGASYQPSSLFLLTSPLTVDNFSNYSTPEFEQLVTAATQSASSAERAEALVELRTFLLEEAFIMPISSNPQVFAHAETISAVDTRVGGGLDFTAASVEQ